MALATQLDYERYIAQGSTARALDPAAVLAVASTEGGFGGPTSQPGDFGTSFGPFQLHRGGALPSGVGDPQAWAWSEQGIDYALDRIAGVAQGLVSDSAIHNIVYQFERPADPARESALAGSRYSGFRSLTSLLTSPGGTDPITGSPFSGVSTNGGGGDGPSVGYCLAHGCYLPGAGLINSKCNSCPGRGNKTVKTAYDSTLGLASTIWQWLLDHLKRFGVLLGGVILVIVGIGVLTKAQMA